LTEQSVLYNIDFELNSPNVEPILPKYADRNTLDQGGNVSKLLINEFEYLQQEFRKQKQEMFSNVNELRQKASELQVESSK